MQSDLMDIDSGAGRPSTQRSDRTTGRMRSERMSGGGRSSPYSRSTPPGDIDGVWKHDLFDTDSNIYRPKPAVYLNHWAANTKLSPSLRPFGDATPSTSTPPPPHPSWPNLGPGAAPPSAPASMRAPSTASPAPPQPAMTLMQRITSIRGAALANTVGSIERPAASTQVQRLPIPQTQHRPAATAAVQSPSPSEYRELKEAESRARKEFNEAMRVFQEGPVDVQVTNLADGTSEDDVRTAFADYGAIQACSTSAGPAVGGQPTLQAHLTFAKKKDAQAAVSALDGALADGLQLGVKITASVGKKPVWSEWLAAARTSVLGTSHAAPDPSTPVVPQASKMRSDDVALQDPRASTLSQPRPTPSYTDNSIRPPSRPPPPQPPLTSRIDSGGGRAVSGPAVLAAAEGGQGGGTLLDRMERGGGGGAQQGKSKQNGPASLLNRMG